jgi:hypothetical protein
VPVLSPCRPGCFSTSGPGVRFTPSAFSDSSAGPVLASVAPALSKFSSSVAPGVEPPSSSPSASKIPHQHWAKCVPASARVLRQYFSQPFSLVLAPVPLPGAGSSVIPTVCPVLFRQRSGKPAAFQLLASLSPTAEGEKAPSEEPWLSPVLVLTGATPGDASPAQLQHIS